MGCPHPDYLLEYMTQEQFADWVAFAQRQPWGFEVEDARHAMLLSLIANIAGGKTTPKDFSMHAHLNGEAGDDHEAQLTSILGPLIKPDALPAAPPVADGDKG